MLARPAHEFVPTKMWQLESILENENGIAVTMFTQSDEHTGKCWPGEFHLVHRVAELPQGSNALLSRLNPFNCALRGIDAELLHSRKRPYRATSSGQSQWPSIPEPRR